MPIISDIGGLWRRSLIAWPDGRTDRTTSVRWLQGPSLYGDLRQPSDRPNFRDARCLRQLDWAGIAWLARQEGFAGEIVFDGSYFEWRRQINLQPKAALADVGRLRFEGDMMIEEGRDAPYIEHWRRDMPTSHLLGGIGLREARTGQAGIIVRAGNIFMYARDRAAGLPAHATLPECIKDAGLDEAQDLIDCEISLGRITAASWRIEHSSLPFKEQRFLKPTLTGAIGDQLRTMDIAPAGEFIEREWDVVCVQGALAKLIGSGADERCA